MNKSKLALRLSLTSVGMIFAVYMVMQIVSFAMENVVLGLSGMDRMVPTVAAFMGVYVLPLLVLFGLCLYILALPMQRILERLRAGETVDAGTAERTRVRLLRFSHVILVLNVMGFAAGFVVLVLVTDGPAGLLTPYRLMILVSNIAGSIVYASAQTSLDNLALGELRDLLGLQEIGKRKREVSRSSKQAFVGVALVVYVLTFLQFNEHLLLVYGDIAVETLAASSSPEEAASAFRSRVSKVFTSVASRPGFDAASLPLPWESLPPDGNKEYALFLLEGLFMLAISIMIHATNALDVRDQLSAMRGRLRDVLEGEGDLRKRLNLRALDEYGEQADLVNRLLASFHALVSRITSAAAETRGMATSVDRVLKDAEAVSSEAGNAVLALSASIAAQAEESRGLTAALESFRAAATAVEGAVAEQRRFADGTAVAMEEMSANIKSVESMTARSGSLTQGLAKQGEEGSRAERETGSAIADIDASANDVLKVLGSLSKISSATNLLAMNAAIEAAHAGEYGAGFAVVAGEVRQLAIDAARQTKAIKDLVAAMTARVRRGVETSGVSGSAFSRLAEGIGQAAGISREIADAMKEQGAGTGEVVGSMSRVVGASETIKARMDEQGGKTEAMALSLDSALSRLADLAEASRAQADAVRKLEASFGAVRAEVDRNLAASGALERELSRFKL